MSVSWLIVAVFIITAIALWLRTTNQHERELAHLSELQAQTVISQLSIIERFLKTIGEDVATIPDENFVEMAAERLRKSTQYHLNVEGIALIDPHGRFLAADFDIDQENYTLPEENRILGDYLDMMNEPRFQIGRPYFFDPLQRWVIPLRQPVFNARGQLLGSVSVAYRIDDGFALATRDDLPADTQIALVRSDGYLTYLYPIDDEFNDPQTVYTQPVSAGLRALLSLPTGLYSYLRPSPSHDGLMSYSAYIGKPNPYAQTIVVLRSKRAVVQAWLSSMILPTSLLLFCVVVLFYAYRNAQRIIDTSEQEIETRQKALMNSLTRYSQLTAMMPAGVYQVLITFAGPRQFVFLSERARGIFALPANLPVTQAMEKVVGMIHPEDLNRFIELEEKAVANSQPLQWEGRFFVEGEEKCIVIHSRPGSTEENGILWHGVMVDVTEQRRATRQLDELTNLDTVTSLPNRTFLHQRVYEAINEARRSHCVGLVLSVDLDNFKLLNDSVGQIEGDYALYLAGERLAHAVDEHGIAARILADEFVLLVANAGTTEKGAFELANRIVEHIQSAFVEPLQLHHDQYQMTVSIGVATLSAVTQSVEQVLQQADQAMYEAKSQGRNLAIFFDAEMEQRLQARLELQRELHRAILAEELELHYQPKVNIKGEVVGVEALTRWVHPIRGMISPVDFIAIAEQSADILILGRWVLRSACQQLVEWQKDPVRKSWTMAVNVSVKQLREASFVTSVKEILESTGAPASQLFIEITESMLLGQAETAIGKMSQLKQLGVRFALDDFGTGYSNLNYLYRLPIDQLKIDQSFVMNMDKNQTQQQIITSIIALGHALKLQVVAEGVETLAQSQALHDHGCDLFQGFYFSPAVRPSALRTSYNPAGEI
ncbi:MAG: EAL domain-containing protein [Aliidiomarina sp.]|uniref:bifunctional diguanylate cyclase/phosphodiesterase n=1 Tax=Aliidiomarina sp. TaxID=1872439 RepID=UPI0025B7DF3E|nr:EAL domain-containing protein [Aliidiomarina sp.]MCH8501569.1 EAL domain-containing protein [Aliidiomarina sp.]